MNTTATDYNTWVATPFKFKERLINADLGEGYPNDTELMQVIHAASIACGGHTGNEESMTTAVQLAKKHGVIIGAHPAYNDKANFGRKSFLNTSSPQSKKDIIQALQVQIDSLIEICHKEHVRLRYIKPHGALYHDLSLSESLANLFCQTLLDAYPNTAVIAQAHSAFIKKAKCLGLETWPESFIDRQYDQQGSLVARNHPSINAVLNQEQAIQQAQSLLQGWVLNEKGQRIIIDSKTLCVHGDTPQSLAIAKQFFYSTQK